MNFFKKLTVASLIMGTTISLSFPFFSNATNLEKELNKYESLLTQNVGNISTIDNNEDFSRYSEAYQKYLKLSEEEKSKVNVIPRKYDVPFEEIYNIKENQNEKSLFNNVGGEINQEEEIIPNKFDLRDKIDIKVENQGAYGLCWTFAPLSCIETNLALKQGIDKDFSESHVNYMTSDLFYKNYREYDNKYFSSRVLYDGGSMDVFYDYILKNPGPVLEEEVPYDKIYNVDEYEYLMNLETKAYVEDMVRFPTMSDSIKQELSEEQVQEFRDVVKKHIMAEGSVAAVIFFDEFFYNSTTYSYCNNMVEVANHAVTIVGWDDNYPKENFLEGSRPENDGAYIVLNSWGEEFGEKGFLYISYEDILIEEELDGVINASVTPIEGDIVEFKDENLYNALKEKFEDSIINYNDTTLTIEFNTLTNNITDKSIDLSNLGIKDVTGLEYFNNYNGINLSHNEIEDIPTLKNMKINSIDLSYNNIKDLSNIPNVSELNLSNCNLTSIDSLITEDNNRKKLMVLDLSRNDITDLSCLSKISTQYSFHLSTINLSENKNLLLETLNIQVISLILEDCNLDNEKLNIMKNIGIDTLNISKNNISDITVLKDTDGLRTLHMNYTQVKQLPSLDNLTFLEAKGLSELQGFEKCPNLWYLDLSDSNLENLDNVIAERIEYLILDNNNLTDLSDLSRYECLEILSINNNPNIDLTTIPQMIQLSNVSLNKNNLKDLSILSKVFSKVYSINLNDNQIEDLSELENFKILQSIELNNNNIRDISILMDKEYLLSYEVDNNMIDDLPTSIDSMSSDYSMRNQECTLPNIDLEINNKNKIDLPQVLTKLYEDRYKTDFKYTAEGCTIDFEKGKLIVEPTSLGEGTCKITIDKGGIYTGTTYTLNYNAVEKIEVIEIEIVQGGKNKYIEGEDFDASGYVINVIYENGLYEEITDYEIIDGTNLQKGQEQVLIKYDDFELQIDIAVYSEDEVEKIKFNDVTLYNIMCEHLMYINGEGNLISINPNELEIVITKEALEQVEEVSLYGKEITDYTGISKFYNIKTLEINWYNALDTSELEKLPKLENLYISYTTLENFEGLCNIPTLKSIMISGVNDITIGELMKNLEICYIDTHKSILEAQVVENRVYISQYIKQMMDYIQEPVVYIMNAYEETELKLQEDSNGNLYVEIDMEKVKEKLNIGDLIFNISVRDANNKYIGIYGVEYAEIQYGYEVTDDFVLDILPNTPIEDFKSIFVNNIDYTIEVKETVEDENETTSEIIKTGMIVQVKNSQGNVVQELKTVVKGDMNCDGVADTKDWIALKGYRTEVVEFSQEQIEAADLNNDGELNYIDSKLLLLHRAEVDGYDLNYKK